MERRNSWKMAATVFVISVAVVLMGAGFMANAKDQGPKEKNLFVSANTVLGGRGVPFPSGPVCVLTNRYPQGQQVVWRIKVFNPAGNPMDDTQLNSVVVTVPDVEGGVHEFEAEFGGHPPGPFPTDFFWAATWEIPSDYPTGTFPYEVVATARGHRAGRFEEFNVGPSLLTIVPGIPAPIVP
jgi:hypothetical protein